MPFFLPLKRVPLLLVLYKYEEGCAFDVQKKSPLAF